MGGTTKFRNYPISVVLLKVAKAAKAAKVAKAAKASTVMCHCRWRYWPKLCQWKHGLRHDTQITEAF